MDLRHVVVHREVAAGLYTLRVRDVTEGGYGEHGRCGDVAVVLDVAASPATEEDGTSTGAGEGEEGEAATEAAE